MTIPACTSSYSFSSNNSWRHHNALLLQSGDYHGRKWKGGEHKAYVSIAMNVSQLGIEAENLSWRCDGYQDQQVSEDNQDGDVVVAQEPRIWTWNHIARIHRMVCPKNYANGIKNGTSWSSNVNWRTVVPIERFILWVAKAERLKCQGCFDKVLVDLQGTEL
jgi:hypothetical protein